MDILLVNPRVPVPTPAVFAALKSRENPPMPDLLPDWADAAGFGAWLAGQRNDLLAPALEIAPAIGEVLAILRDEGCLFAGMSGSGATCFALYPPDGHSAKSMTRHIRRLHPGWWAVARPAQLIRATT